MTQSDVMEELRQRYQQIRGVLGNLVDTLGDAPVAVALGHELWRSRAYLHRHCAECGCAITAADDAQIYAQECTRVGAAGMAGIEAQPICPACYARLRRALSAFAPGPLTALQPQAVAHRLGGPDEITVSTHRTASPVRAEQLRHPLIGRASRAGAGRTSGGRGVHAAQWQREPRHGALPLRRP